jgi:hypothetical protein
MHNEATDKELCDAQRAAPRATDVIMAVGGEDEIKNIFETEKWIYVKLP